jgi:hypothetical protein
MGTAGHPPSASEPRRGSPLPHLHHGRAHPFHRAAQEIVEAFMAAVTDRTRLAMVDAVSR